MRLATGSIALALAAPATAQTYEATLLPAQPVVLPQDAQPLHLGDDATAKVDLGFDFPYWGQTFDRAWVSSNGFVSFQSAANLCCDGVPIDQAPRNTIYGFWTDLISYPSNPYYRRSEGSILFGWYGTTEYGTNNQQTFEIDLSSTGSITFNFGAMSPMSYHMATTGITGPTKDDNISLFYGRNPAVLSYQSGRLGLPEPEPVLDCTVTPLDPACPPQMVAPIQIITSPVVETIHEAYAEEVAADQAETLVATVAEPEQEITVAVVTAEQTSITEQVEVASTTAAVEAERLSPDQVAALAASGPVFEVAAADTFAGAFTTFGTRFDGSVAAATTSSASGANSAANPIEAASSTTSQSAMANTMEALSMLPAVPAAGAQAEQPQSGMAEGQGETMAAIAAVPGFSAYTQVALQDRPDFYAVRDIYRNRRLRDANFEMYRMTNTNTTKWQRMVDDQY